MSMENVWDLEIEYLAEQWMPLFTSEVMGFYRKRKAVLKSAKFAFAETYERFFLSPSAEGAHQ